MFPEKHQGTLRERMGCGVQLSAQPSIYIYTVYILKQVHSYTQNLQIPWKIAKTMKIMW